MYGTLDTDILYPWINSIIELRMASLKYSYEELVYRIKVLNTTSEYIHLYKDIFKTTALPFNSITKLDFESCITTTKLAIFKKKDIPHTLDIESWKTSFLINALKPKEKKYQYQNF